MSANIIALGYRGKRLEVKLAIFVGGEDITDKLIASIPRSRSTDVYAWMEAARKLVDKQVEKEAEGTSA